MVGKAVAILAVVYVVGVFSFTRLWREDQPTSAYAEQGDAREGALRPHLQFRGWQWQCWQQGAPCQLWHHLFDPKTCTHYFTLDPNGSAERAVKETPCPQK